MESAPATHQGCELRSGGRSTAFARIFRFRVAGFIAVRTQELVSQFEQMYVSACYRASAGKLSCISCHDPHELPTPDRRVAYYRNRCLQCHRETSCSLPVAVR